MRKKSSLLFFIFILFAGFSSFSQATVTISGDSRVVPEKLPEFKKGMRAWINFLERNLDRDLLIKQNAPVGKYMVIVNFLVGVDGGVSDIKIEYDRGYGTAEEVKRIIKLSDKNWLPASDKGVLVPFRHVQSITFTN
jgi:protein TonB